MDEKSHNYIDDTEVEVQRRRTAGWEVGINHTHYISDLVLQILLVTSVVQAVIKRYLHQKKRLVKGLHACKFLQPDLI